MDPWGRKIKNLGKGIRIKKKRISVKLGVK